MSTLLDRITPVVLTYNEEPNLRRCLDGLGWAHRIVIVDSGSTDGTLGIAGGRTGVEVLHRPFDDFARQRNHGLERVESEWALSLDADFVVDEALRSELERLEPPADVDAYDVPFRYCMYGRPLRGSLLAPQPLLFRTARGRFRQDGHAESLEVPGERHPLSSPILHDDRKPLSVWLASQDRYATDEARKLAATPWGDLSLPDRVRRTVVLAPGLVLLWCLVGKGGLLDGWPGWLYAFERVVAEMILGMHIIRRRIAGGDGEG